jgi:hypothetical protein
LRQAELASPLDLNPTDPNKAATATSNDGGKTWALTTKPPVTGAIFGKSYVRAWPRVADARPMKKKTEGWGRAVVEIDDCILLGHRDRSQNDS